MFIDLIQFNLLQGKKRIGPSTKDASELHYLRVEYQANHWMNTNNNQMDVGTATDTGAWKLVIGADSVVVYSLFNVLHP